jgi:hypothetical protein
MPTTATARPYTGADVPQGPAEVWIKVAVPGAGAGLVLHTDGSVDATTNTTAVFLGKLKAGAKFSYKPSFFEGQSDESADSFRRLISAEELTITGEWMELQSAIKLANMMVGATSNTITGPPATTLIQLGGLTIPPTFSAALVWTQPEATSKYVSLQLYKTLNMGETVADITKKALASAPFIFRALSVDSRAVGDRLGAINIYT